MGAESFRQDAAEPLYVRIGRTIADQVAAGVLRPGERLPPERTFCERFGVSRMTLRRALSELVADGVLIASPGRGWYVAASIVSEPPNELLSFSAMGAARGLEPSARVLASRTRPATLDEAELLAVAPGAALFELERLRLLDGLPVSVDHTRVPLALAPDLPSLDFAAASLYAALERGGAAPVRADYVVEAAPADDATAPLLGLTAGEPLLVATQVTYDAGGRPIELGRMAYRGDRYRFRATLARRPPR